jgi:hypothetical protein
MGDWLNGWLAALGITVLLPDARLCFASDATTVAVVELEDERRLEDAIAHALPTRDALDALSIAKPRISRTVLIDAYREAAAVARAHSDFSLASSVTDLSTGDGDKELSHSPFDPPAPRGETLWSRLVRCREALGEGEALLESIEASLAGRGARIDANGLGFDYRRIPAAALGSGQIRVDPVVECLAFYGLCLFPVRGDGQRALTRGWRWDPGARRARFIWPTWREPLDRFSIDALLGMLFASDLDEKTLRRFGVEELYEVVPYRSPAESRDVTCGFAARRVR